MMKLSTGYKQAIENALYTLEIGVQYAFINSVIRSILQNAALTALELCYAKIPDIEHTDLPALSLQMLAPADGVPLRVLNSAIPFLRQSAWKTCCDGWFKSDPQSESINRRAEIWVRHRNNYPGHGVVSNSTIASAMEWIPDLAQSLVVALGDLLPNGNSDDNLLIEYPIGNGLKDTVPIACLRFHNGKPIVVRNITPRGASWRITYQTLDPNSSEDSYFDITSTPPIVSLARESKSLYRQLTVQLFNKQHDSDLEYDTWKPLVLLPAKQTPIFEGRQQEISLLAEWMDDMDSRVCNVFGEGGIGKTTLVLEYLHSIMSGEVPAPSWRPDIICFFSAKQTLWGPEGLQILRGVLPAIDEAAREIARCYDEKLDKTWFEGEPRQIIDKAVSLLVGLGFRRDNILLVLDNSETLARSIDEEDELGRIIAYISKKLCRVMITSRRREKMEAYPLKVPPMEDDVGAKLLRRLGLEYNAKPILDAGVSNLKSIVRQFSGRPLLLDVLARLVGKFGYSLSRGMSEVLRLASQDLGIFLYEDAWARVNAPERLVFLVIGQLGGTVNGDAVGWSCAELGVAHSQFLSAFDETRFGTLLEYGSHYDLTIDQSARAFLQHKYSDLREVEQARVSTCAKVVRRKHSQWLSAHGSTVNDRVAQAFRTDAAKAAYLAGKEGRLDDAVRWFEEAIQADRGNAALLERFAWFLLFKKSDLERATRLAAEACKADSTDADAFFTAGLIAARKGEVAVADRALAQAETNGKAKHLCALQQARCRIKRLDQILGIEPVDIDTAKHLETGSYALLESANLKNPMNTLEQKHMHERNLSMNHLDRLSNRINILVLHRKHS